MRRTNVSRETSERLDRFEATLRRWNRRINLVGDRTLADLTARHIDDSLQLVALLPPSGRIVDLGSGAGFPGLIVALATGRHVTLVEADRRKAAFLQEAGRATEAPVTVIARRVEASGLVDVDVVLARALAPLPLLLTLASPLLRRDGVCLFLKGARAASELTEAEARWQMEVLRHPSATAPDGCILEIRSLRRRDRPD